MFVLVLTVDCLNNRQLARVQTLDFFMECESTSNFLSNYLLKCQSLMRIRHTSHHFKKKRKICSSIIFGSSVSHRWCVVPPKGNY
jgi:hypothetical protein